MDGCLFNSIFIGCLLIKLVGKAAADESQQSFLANIYCLVPSWQAMRRDGYTDFEEKGMSEDGLHIPVTPPKSLNLLWMRHKLVM